MAHSHWLPSLAVVCVRSVHGVAGAVQSSMSWLGVLHLSDGHLGALHFAAITEKTVKALSCLCLVGVVPRTGVSGSQGGGHLALAETALTILHLRGTSLSSHQLRARIELLFLF